MNTNQVNLVDLWRVFNMCYKKLFIFCKKKHPNKITQPLATFFLKLQEFVSSKENVLGEHFRFLEGCEVSCLVTRRMN